MATKRYLAILIAVLTLCITTWLWALWFTEASLDYRTHAGSSFMALRLSQEAGVSYQWSEQGQSVVVDTGE